MSLKVEIDWNKDGDYSDISENVTEFVRAKENQIGLEYGRDQSTALAPVVAGRGSLVLDNDDRRFSPRNTASPIYGFVKPSRPVRITRTMPVSGTTYTLFVGHTDDSPINPDATTKKVSLSLVDSLADFRGVTISTPLYQGVTTGQAIGYILDACGWSVPLRDIDAGSTVIPWWWEDGTDALTALEKCVRSEGPPAMLTVGDSGEIVFKDRQHRFLDTASLTSQATFRGDGMIEPVMGIPFGYDEAWKNIINTGTASVDVRTGRPLAAVWTLDSPISFDASETKTFIASSSDPFFNAVAPADTTDYTVTSGSISSTSISRTSGASTTITITAGGGGAQIGSLQLRAQPVQTAYTVQVTASDSSSITDYGQRSFPGDLPWCNQYDAKAILDKAVQERAQPLPVVQARFVLARNETRSAAILVRNLSDRVTISEAETVLNSDFFVESFAHQMAGEHDHAVTIGAEGVPPAGDTTSSNIFILGSAVVGHRLGTGVLAP